MTPVSETLALKIENLQLRMEACKAQFEQLAGQQQALLTEARQEVGASDEATAYNFQTREFSTPNGAKPLSAPLERRQRRMRAGK